MKQRSGNFQLHRHTSNATKDPLRPAQLIGSLAATVGLRVVCAEPYGTAQSPAILHGYGHMQTKSIPAYSTEGLRVCRQE